MWNKKTFNWAGEGGVNGKTTLSYMKGVTGTGRPKVPPCGFTYNLHGFNLFQNKNALKLYWTIEIINTRYFFYTECMVYTAISFCYTTELGLIIPSIGREFTLKREIHNFNCFNERFHKNKMSCYKNKLWTLGWSIIIAFFN